MALLPNLKRLLIPRKGSNKVTDLDTNWRAIEKWGNAITTGGGGTIQRIITGTPLVVTITNPTGPITSIDVATVFYASLTGPGETTSPGALTQAGNFTVNGTLTVNGVLSANAPGADHLLQAGSTTDIATLLVNGAAAIRDPGTISFQGSGGSTSSPSPIQFIAVTVAPTFTIVNPTYAFLIGLAGHIYYNPGGPTWTLLI